MYRRAILVGLTVLISVSALFGVFPQIASADGTPTPYLAPTVVDAATKSTERNSLAICLSYDSTSHGGAAIKNSNYGYDIDPQMVASGDWFSDWTQVRQWFDYNKGGDGTNCDKFDSRKAIQDLGWTSNIQAGCDLGMQRKNGSNCVSGTGNFEWKGGDNKQDVLNRIDKVYKGSVFGKDYTGEQYYVMAISVLMNDKTCKASAIAAASSATADQQNSADAKITIVGSDGVATQVYYKFGGDKGETWSFRNGTGGDFSVIKYKCSELAGVANDNANAYAKWVAANQPGTAGNPGSCEQYATLQVGGPAGKTSQADLYKNILNACDDGHANKTDPSYCNTKYPQPKHVPNLPPGDQPKSAENAACVYGQQSATDSPNTGTTDNPTGTDSKPTCGIQGIGWLVCPVMNFMAKVNDAAYNFLASYFLSVDTKLVTESQPAWAKFRDIANVAFVVAILFVVYSQVTSMGIGNYGIKRMLPRIIVAALLVNVSFYICAAAVDLSNLLGYAIPQFFGNIPIGAGLQDSGGLANLGSGLSWVLIIGGVVAAAVGVALAISVPVILAALLAIGLIVLMLVARQAFIVLLLVISPLAFVAYLLPNTEQWFKKWYKAFFTLLMLFPVVGTVFGASRMAALIINNSGGGSQQVITQLVALAVSAVPFFVVPGLLKGSLAAAGTLGTKLQGMANKSTGKIGSQVKNTSRLGTGLADMKKFRDSERAAKFAKSRGTGVMAGVARIPGMGGAKYNERARTRGAQLEIAEHEEDVKAAGQDIAANQSYDNIDRIARGETKDAQGNALSYNATQREAAIRHMMDKGNFTERQKVLQSAGSMNEKQRKSAVNAAYAKGDGSIYGSGTLGQVMDAKDGDAVLNNVAQHLNDGAVKKINDGEIAPETFHRDSYTSGYLAEQSKQASDGPDGGKQKLANSLAAYAATDQGKKVAASTQADAAKVVQGAPTPPQPSAPQPAAQPTQQASTAQLNIPHGGGTPPATPPPAGSPSGAAPHTPPGTSNYQQGSSGLWVPPGAGGGNPPSTP